MNSQELKDKTNEKVSIKVEFKEQKIKPSPEDLPGKIE